MGAALWTDGRPSTLKELAASAGVSVPTLRHYFGDRDEVVLAVLAQAERDAAPHLALHDLDQPVRDALLAHLGRFIDGWGHPALRHLVLGGVTGGIDHALLGPAAVNHVLEPTLQALEARLAHYQAQGDLRASLDPRHGSIALFAPVVVALLHQHDLSGAACRPLEVAAFVEELVEAFLRAWGR